MSPPSCRFEDTPPKISEGLLESDGGSTRGDFVSELSPLTAAQERLEKKRLELGIKWGPQRARSWAKDRMAEWYGKHPEDRAAGGKGRHVRCVECGHESRVETNRTRRLKTLACQQPGAPGASQRCDGRLRPVSWFRGSGNAV